MKKRLIEAHIAGLKQHLRCVDHLIGNTQSIWDARLYYWPECWLKTRVRELIQSVIRSEVDKLATAMGYERVPAATKTTPETFRKKRAPRAK